MQKQREETAAGAIIYSPKRRQFLILRHRDGHWEFPKGKLEPGESFDEARAREIKEETNLSGEFVNGFSEQSTYEFYRHGRVHKVVEYALMLTDDPVEISSEHSGYQWASYPKARSLLKFKEHRDLLKKAAGFLVRRGRIISGFSF